VFNSFGDITSKIIEIENREKLFEWKVNNVYIWEIIRYKIYAAAVNVSFESGARANKTPFLKSLISKIGKKTDQYFNALLNNPFFNKEKVDVLVIESSRKLKFENEYIDPYTKFTCDELKQAGVKHLKFQSSYVYDKLVKKDDLTKHLDLINILSGYASVFIKLDLKETDRIKTESIETLLKNELGVSLNLLELVKGDIKKFKSNSWFYKRLLKSKAPREIYIVNFCDKPALIACAKEQQITVIDIQHGLISSHDIIYNYPNVSEGSLHYFPDKFYIWSDVWKEAGKLPLTDSNIVVYGNKFLEKQVELFRKVVKQPKQTIIISQPGLTQKIARTVLENYEAFQSFNVLYKLHPNEYATFESYPEYKELKAKSNLSFVGWNEDLYKLLAESTHVVGVGSTVLVEALSFNCKVLVLNLPGAEWMEPFLKKKQVEMYTRNSLN